MREPARHAEAVRELYQMYTDGKIQPRVTAIFPLEEAAKALKLMEERKIQGKAVLTVD